jgi:hypothetical protein
MADNNKQIRVAAMAARYYRSIGLSPLPSRSDRKRPDLVEFSHLKTECPPSSMFTGWSSPNIQLMLGYAAYGKTKIIVVDCDGEEAVSVWKEIMFVNGGIGDTWTVKTGGGGLHTYFKVNEPVKSGMLWGQWDTWRKAWVKHKEVRVLGDGSLSVAPPSVHVDTGIRYRFEGQTPASGAPIAEAPRWLIDMPRLATPRLVPDQAEDKTRTKWHSSDKCRLMDHGDVLGAIKDKAAVARSWGLRVTSKTPNPNGWYSCRAIGRDDSNPSASFHGDAGIYVDMKTMESIGFFELGVRLGEFQFWADAVMWCEQNFCTCAKGGVH